MLLSDAGTSILAKNLKKKPEPSGPFSLVRIVEPYPFTYSFKVKESNISISISRLFYIRFPFRTEEDWAKRVELGYIKVNGETVSPDFVVKVQDQISHYSPSVREPSVPDNVKVLFEGNGFIVVDKPAPMPVHAGGRYHKNTLIAILSEQGYAPLHVVHRLDAVTSGLMILATTKEKAGELTQNFQTSGITKVYHALVKGLPDWEEIKCDLPVRRDKGFRFTTSDGSGAKPALTEFRCLHRGKTGSIIECKPVTGRTHQIRVHLKALGYPIANDFVYLNDSKVTTLQNRPIFLQQSVLGLPTEHNNFEIPIPDDWFRILEDEAD